jgi:hypothetical protein
VVHRVQRGGWGPLFRLAGLHLQGLLDHPVGEDVEVGGQGPLQLLEFPPEGVVHEAAAEARHHGGVPLAAVAVGGDAMAPHQRHEQMA